MRMRFPLLLAMIFFFSYSYAQKVEVDDDSVQEVPIRQETGRKAAQKYFQQRKGRSVASSSSGGPRFLALHLGRAFDESSNKWGNNNSDDVGRLDIGVTYRVGEWTNSMDLMFRANFFTYSLNEGNATKLSLMPMITFPDASSRFPLYFGAGAGLGIFLKQIRKESSLSLDYQIVAGARFFDVFNSVGVMFELGMKNHIFLTSDGQYQSVFGAVGAVFNF